jgi:hypothetical protein
MIAKLDLIENTDNLYDKNGFITNVACGSATISKINELVDAVNTIQKEREAEWFEIQEWIGILEAVRKSVNIHEKQIDGLQMKVEPEKCETRSENVQTDAETRSGNVQDKFAQYRRWAGKLCRFWDIDKDKAIYDILEEVIADWSYQFKTKSDYIFDHCEPVLPTDNAIYKGGDNE